MSPLRHVEICSPTLPALEQLKVARKVSVEMDNEKDLKAKMIEDLLSLDGREALVH